MNRLMNPLIYLKTYHKQVFDLIPEPAKHEIFYEEVLSQAYRDRPFVRHIQDIFLTQTQLAEQLNIPANLVHSNSSKGYYDNYKIQKIRGMHLPGGKSSKYWYDRKILETISNGKSTEETKAN